MSILFPDLWPLGQFRQTEVEHFHQTTFIYHDVSRLEVTMNDPGGLGFRQCIGDLDGVLQDIIQLQPAAWNQLAERLALDIFHDNEVGAIVTGDVMDGDDVGMIEGRGGFGFLDEAPLAIRIGDEFGWKHFDGNKAVQMLVACLVDNSHPSLAEKRENLVVPQLPTRQGLMCRDGTSARQ